MGVKKRVKQQSPGNVTTEQNAAQLSQAERTSPNLAKVTRTRTSFITPKGQATPEAFDDLNATNPDEGKNLTLQEPITSPELQTVIDRIKAAREKEEEFIAASRTRRAEVDQTKTTPQGGRAALLAEIERIEGIQQDTQNVITSLETIRDERLAVASSRQQVQDEADEETVAAATKTLRIEDNPLSKFDNVTYNFRLFMTGETAQASTLSSEDIVVIAETGSTGFNITDVDINTVISPSLLTKNSYATLLKITIIEPHGNSLIDRMRNAAISLGVEDHKDIPLWFTISFKGYYQGENNAQNSHDGGIPTGEINEETRTWHIKLKRIEAEINKGGTEYVIISAPLNEQGMGDAARRLETETKIDAFDLGEFFKNLSKELNKNLNYSTFAQASRDDTVRVRKYAFSLPKGDELDFAKISLSSQINDMSTWEIRGENIADNKRTESFTDQDGTRKWRITFGKGTAIEAIIQEIIGTTAQGQSLALYGEKRGTTYDINHNQHREPTKPSVIFTVEPTTDITSYNGVARAYNTLIIYHIRPYLTFIPILSRDQIEESLEARKSRARFVRQLKVTNIRKKYEYMFSGLNTEVLDYKIKFDRTWFLALPIFQGQNRTAVGISSGFTNEKKSNLKIVQEGAARNDAIKDLDVKIKQNSTLLTGSSLASLSSGVEPRLALLERRARLETEQRELLEAQRAGRFDVLAAQRIREELKRQALRPGARRIDTSFFGSGAISLESDILDQGANINVLLESNIIISDDERKLVDEVKNRLRNKQNIRGSIFFVEDTDRLEQEVSGPDTSKKENQAHHNVGTELSPTINSSEIGIEGTISKGRSFFSTVMNQVYGNQGVMRKIQMTIRGDPYWLGEPDIVKRLTIATVNSRDITRSDSLILMTFAFPNGINDGGDARADSFKGTGLYNLDRRENGFNGVYYIVQVDSHFSDGKFTQKLTGLADILTQESDVITAVTTLNNSTGN